QGTRGGGVRSVEGRARSTRRLAPAVALAALLALAVGGPPAAARPGASDGPFLTLLFSRTAVTAASNCVADDTGIVRLDPVVAPTLFARGLHPTGTIETGPTQPSSLWCGHFKLQLYASWDLERQLASSYGWTFGSHTKTYPDSLAKWSALTPQQVL